MQVGVGAGGEGGGRGGEGNGAGGWGAPIAATRRVPLRRRHAVGADDQIERVIAERRVGHRRLPHHLDAGDDAGHQVCRPLGTHRVDRRHGVRLATGSALGPVEQDLGGVRVGDERHPVALLERRDHRVDRVLANVELAPPLVDLVAIIGGHLGGGVHAAWGPGGVDCASGQVARQAGGGGGGHGAGR